MFVCSVVGSDLPNTVDMQNASWNINLSQFHGTVTNCLENYQCCLQLNCLQHSQFTHNAGFVQVDVIPILFIVHHS